MNENTKKTKGNLWNQTASDEDILIMENDRTNMTEEEFRQKYEFSKSKALNILYSRLPEKYQRRQKPMKEKKDILEFSTQPMEVHPFTIYITDDTKERLQNAMRQYNVKRGVFMEAFIDMALSKLEEDGE